MTVNQSRYLVLPDPDRHKPRPPRKVTPPPFLPENRPLTKKQEKFVRELVENTGRITLREAAERAGYSARGASVRASELTNPAMYPHVVKRILEVRSEMKIKYGIDEDQHLADLWRLRAVPFRLPWPPRKFADRRLGCTFRNRKFATAVSTR